MGALNSLEELENYKILFKENYTVSEDIILNSNIIGGEKTNTSLNRMFNFKFEKSELEEAIKSYEILRMGTLNGGKIHNLILKLKELSKNIIKDGRCPVECILYASKTINNILINNWSLVESLGDLITTIYFECEYIVKDVLKFILNEWRWTPQINIVINACGKIKDLELLKVVYENHTGNESKMQALKAFINSGEAECITYSLNLMAYLGDDDIIEKQMCNTFKERFVASFGNEGILKANQFINSKGISKKSIIQINKALPKDRSEVNLQREDDVCTISKMISIAKNHSKDKGYEDKFIKFTQSSKTRRNAYVALRWSKDKSVSKIIKESLLKYKNRPNEIGEGIITLALLNDNECLKIANKYIKNTKVRVYCYGALSILGNSKYTNKLVREFFELEDLTHVGVFEIMKQCSHENVREEISEMIKEYTRSDLEDNIIKGLGGASILYQKQNLKEIVLREINYLIGDCKEKFNCSGKIAIQILNLIGELFVPKNEPDFIKILFRIRENEAASLIVKSKADAILKKAQVAPPK